MSLCAQIWRRAYGKLAEVSESALGDEFLDGEEIGVPPAVLVYGEDEVLFPSELGEFVRLLGRGRDGFLDDDVLAGEEGLLGELVVGVVDRADPDGVDLGNGERLVESVDDVDARVLVAGFRLFGSCGSLDNHLEVELFGEREDCGSGLGQPEQSIPCYPILWFTY